jgi:LysR family nod box-dependent transcriptional activator
MRFKRLDLNLLVVLDALLREHSVSRAAEQLNLSQPAVSSALSRLREYFNDDILVMHGKKMLPTAHALSIAPLVQRTLADINELIAASTIFEPATSQRLFRLAAPDHLVLTLLLPLVAELEHSAPGLRFDIRHLTPDSARALDSGELDVLLVQQARARPDHPQRLVFEQGYVCVGCARNPLFSAAASEAALPAQSVLVAAAEQASSLEDGVWQEINRRWKVDVLPYSLLEVLWMLPGTQRVAVTTEQVASAMASRLPLATRPLPLAVPALREVLQYHSARHSDGGVQWLVAQLLRHAATGNAAAAA